MRKAVFALVFSFCVTGTALAQEAPAPCGPKMQLPPAVSANVAADSRCFELRMYTAEPAKDGKGGIKDLHQRFREQEVAIFEKLGAKIVAVWQNLDDPNTLIWMLAYRDRAHREEVWAKFRVDPDWLALRQKYPVGVKANVIMMSAADYSALK